MPIFKPSKRIRERYRRLQRLRRDAQLAELRKMHHEEVDHPDYGAQQALEQHLAAAHFDPAIQGSRTFLQLILFLREWIGDAIPGDTLADRFAALHGELSKRPGAGAPSKVNPEQVLKHVEGLQQVWHPAPVAETARRLKVSTKTISRAIKKAKKGGD